jgi:hypothetical protein
MKRTNQKNAQRFLKLVLSLGLFVMLASNLMPTAYAQPVESASEPTDSPPPPPPPPPPLPIGVDCGICVK